MKKSGLLWTALLCYVVFSLCGCGGTKADTLLNRVAYETSDLVLYAYDGEAGSMYVMSDTEAKKEILKSLSRVRIKQAEDWNHNQLTVPIYGLRSSATDEGYVEMAWSTDYCITVDGEVYSFACDFEKLLSQYEWNGIYNFDWPTMLPCAREMSIGEDGWIPWMLVPAEEPVAPQGISMVLTKRDENHLTVEITNNRTEEWAYGTYFSVQVLLDGVWYMIPTTVGEWGFPEIAILHPAGETRTESYSLDRYGELPPGTYRLEKEGMVAEFEVAE